MKTVGIIGFGSFGKFLTEKLEPFCKVLVYSRSGKAGKWSGNLADVARADYVILSLPLDAYEPVLKEIKPLLASETVIVDVCSVKGKPIKIIRSILPGQKLVATHPLFGPESAAESLAGHTLVICPEASDAMAAESIENFAAEQGIKIVKMSAREHDRQMATVQGLTFFIARALKDCSLHEMRLSTPSFERLVNLAELESHHSDELFNTIQNGNGQTAAVRNQFLKCAEKIDEEIQNNKV